MVDISKRKIECFIIYGPTSFFKKTLLDQYGYIREDFHYTMDTELWWRFASNGVQFKRLNQYCWAYRLHEASKMSGHHFQNSQLSDENHPSWQQKKWEHAELTRLYGPSEVNTIRAKSLLVITRLTSLRYLSGRLDNLIYNRIPLLKFLLKKYESFAHNR